MEHVIKPVQHTAIELHEIGQSHRVTVDLDTFLDWLIEDDYSSVTDDYKYQRQWIRHVIERGHEPLKDLPVHALIQEYIQRYDGYDHNFESDHFGILPCFVEGNQGQVTQSVWPNTDQIEFSWYEEFECPEEE